MKWMKKLFMFHNMLNVVMIKWLWQNSDLICTSPTIYLADCVCCCVAVVWTFVIHTKLIFDIIQTSGAP